MISVIPGDAQASPRSSSTSAEQNSRSDLSSKRQTHNSGGLETMGPWEARGSTNEPHCNRFHGTGCVSYINSLFLLRSINISTIE